MVRVGRALLTCCLLALAAPAWGGPAGFQTFRPPAGSGLGDFAGEPSLGSNWKSGRALFQSDLQTLRVTFDESCPASPVALWENKAPLSSIEDDDPIVFTDPQTGRTIVSMLFLLTGKVESSFTDDDGDHWIPSQGAPLDSGIDHQSNGGGPLAPPLTGNPGNPLYPNGMYFCSQAVAAAFCALSLDGGLTFGPAVTIYNLGSCGGGHGKVKVAPDGTVYVPNRDCGAGHVAAVMSTDNGLTWSVQEVGDSSTSISDPSIGIGAAGTLYLGYADGGGHPKVAVGHRSGAVVTWEASQDLGVAFGLQNSTFPATVAGDDDRAAVTFLGSAAAGNYEATTFPGAWHMYAAFTHDGGAQWDTVDTTPDDPVQRGCIWLEGGAVACRNLYDFNDAVVDRDGRLLIAFADGCIGACASAAAAATGNSYTALATLQRQASGLRLFAAKDAAPGSPPALPSAPAVTAERWESGVFLRWDRADDGGSPISEYRVYRRAGAEGADTLLAAVGTSRTYLDAAAAASAPGQFYSVGAVNAVGESPACGRRAAQIAAPAASVSGCAIPGPAAVVDPAGDQVGAPAGRNGDLDIMGVSVAEPFDPAQPNARSLVFTFQMGADLSSLMPNRQWRVVWSYRVPPAGQSGSFDGLYYAGMNSDAAGNASFEYGTAAFGPSGGLLSTPTATQLAGTTGEHRADGTASVVVPAAAVGSPQPGDILGGIFVRTYAGTASANLGAQAAVDTTGAVGSYGAGVGTYGVRGLGCKPGSAGTSFFTLAPCRLLDTRAGDQGGKLRGGFSRTLQMTGACGVPLTAKAVSLNITAIDASEPGALVLYPEGALPPTLVVPLAAGRTRANNTVLGLDSAGQGTLQARPQMPANGSVELVVDVNGWFE